MVMSSLDMKTTSTTHKMTCAHQESLDVSELLRAWSSGDIGALDRLMPLVYKELKKRATSYLRQERIGHTLQTTALVHEVYVKLQEQRAVTWENRRQFYWLASEMMRRILIDHARRRARAKRGAEFDMIPIDSSIQIAVDGAEVDLVRLDNVLKELATFDPQQSKIVELRYFAGCSIQETADILQISPATVKRDWTVAKAWLRHRLNT
jgi:RNA polymerase sigma-70 factor, ECF subfamily